jgi:hypothetical protein
METFALITMAGGFLMGVGATLLLFGVVFYFWGK